MHITVLQGKYEDSRTNCIQCPAGTYNDVAEQSGQSGCKECPDGSVATKKGTDTCTVCQPVEIIT